MIVSDIGHISRQLLMTPALKEGIDFLCRADIQNFPDGKTVINGTIVFALIQRYETKMISDELRFEYHRKYIDIQFIASGEEVVGWAPAECMTITEPYNDEKDVCFGTVRRGEMTQVYLKAGQIAVLYPEDCHAPGLAAGRPSDVMKVVIKIAVGESS